MKIKFYKGDFYKDGENTPMFKNDGVTEQYYHLLKEVRGLESRLREFYVDGFGIRLEHCSFEARQSIEALSILKRSLEKINLPGCTIGEVEEMS